VLQALSAAARLPAWRAPVRRPQPQDSTSRSIPCGVRCSVSPAITRRVSPAEAAEPHPTGQYMSCLHATLSTRLRAVKGGAVPTPGLPQVVALACYRSGHSSPRDHEFPTRLIQRRSVIESEQPTSAAVRPGSVTSPARLELHSVAVSRFRFRPTDESRSFCTAIPLARYPQGRSPRGLLHRRMPAWLAIPRLQTRRQSGLATCCE